MLNRNDEVGTLGAEKKDKTERVTGLGRRTRDELVKWNQMTALRSKRGETSDIPSLPSGGVKEEDTKHEIKWFSTVSQI